MNAPLPTAGHAPNAEYPALIADALADLTTQLDQVRLPLHILLANRFGDLNENQEEMLGAAQTALEHADARIRQLRAMIDLDRGTLALRHDAISARDLITTLLPGLRSQATERGVEISTDFAPALPRIRGDRARLQSAFALLLGERLRITRDGKTLTITVTASRQTVCVEVSHHGTPVVGADETFARRLITASGGEVRENAGRTGILLPTQPPPTG